MNINLEKLNKYIVEGIYQYQNIDVGSYKISTPYAMNVFGIALKNSFTKLNLKEEVDKQLVRRVYDQFKDNKLIFGMYAGKGTALEISDAIKRLIEDFDIEFENLKPEGLVELLRLYGIGIDCSGFVYNILRAAFSEINLLNEFKNSLSWTDQSKMNVRYAGVFVFGNGASKELELSEAQQGDLILFKENNLYTHMALIFEDKGVLKLAESTLYVENPGIQISEWKVKNGFPIRTYDSLINTSWARLYANKQMEIRRLNVLDD